VNARAVPAPAELRFEVSGAKDQFYVVTNPNSVVPFDFCVSNIGALRK
jgi:hypothetical protein